MKNPVEIVEIVGIDDPDETLKPHPKVIATVLVHVLHHRRRRSHHRRLIVILAHAAAGCPLTEHGELVRILSLLHLLSCSDLSWPRVRT